MASFNRWIIVDDHVLAIRRCREQRARHRRMSMETFPVSEISASALLRRKTVEELKRHQVFMRKREEADQTEITEIVEVSEQEKEFGAEVRISAPSTPQSVLCSTQKDLNGDSSSDSSIAQRRTPPNPPPPPPVPPKPSLLKKQKQSSTSDFSLEGLIGKPQKGSISDLSIGDGLINLSNKQNISVCSSDVLIDSSQQQGTSEFTVQHKSKYRGSIEALIGSINALVGSSPKQNCSLNGLSNKPSIPNYSSSGAVIGLSEKQSISCSSIGLEGSCQEQGNIQILVSVSEKLPFSPPQLQTTSITLEKGDGFLCSSENIPSSRQNQQENPIEKHENPSSPQKQSIPSSNQQQEIPLSPQIQSISSSTQKQEIPSSPQKQSIPSSPQKHTLNPASPQKHTFNPSSPQKHSITHSSSQKQSTPCSSQSSQNPQQTPDSSFLLDRFLPAAQSIAHRSPAARAQQNPSTPKTVKWSSSPEIIDEQQYQNQQQHQPVPTVSARSTSNPSTRRHDSKSCGFLTLGFKSALSRAHRSAFGSDHSFSSSRSRSMPHPLKLHRHDADSPCSSEDEQFARSSFSGPWKPKSALVPPTISYTSSSPLSYRVSSPNFAPGYLRENSPRASVWSTQSTPVHIHSQKLHNQVSTSNMPREYQTTYNHADLLADQFIDGEDDDQINGSALHDEPLGGKTEHAGLNGGISDHQMDGFPQYDSKSNSFHDEQDRAGVWNMNANADIAEHSMAASSGLISKKPLKDQFADAEDDVPFFDALSRLNSIGSTPGTLTPCTIGSPKTHHEAYAFPTDWTHDETGFLDASSKFETPRVSTSESNSNSNGRGLQALTPENNSNSNGRGLQASTSENNSNSNGRGSQALTYENNSNSNGSNVLSDLKGKHLSLSQRVGKALKLQTSGTEPDKGSMSPDIPLRSILRHQPRSESFSGRFRHISFDVINDDTHSTGLASPVFPAKCQKSGANDFGWPFGISSCQYPGTGQGKGTSDGQSQNKNDGFQSSKIPAPPLPPAPSGSWLQKAMASRSSKPSTLATLQQKQKVHPTTTLMKDFRYIEATRKDVSWEDVVKGSKMQGLHPHPHHHHHHHPSNHGTLKPLRL